jgi:transposase
VSRDSTGECEQFPARRRSLLTAEERQTLGELANSRKSEARMRKRSRIVLLAAEGMASRAIAREVGCMPGTVSKWRVRYARDRMAGLSETGERGADPLYKPKHGQRNLALLDRPPPAGCATGRHRCWRANWGDIHGQYICRFLRAQKIDLSGCKSWGESTDTEFVAKAADIVGLI